MPTDVFERSKRTLESPAIGGFAITPSDTPFVTYARSIYVGGDGNVVLTPIEGSDLTFVGVKAGSILPIGAKAVKATSTATSMIGLY